MQPRGKISLDQQIRILRTIRITTANEALRLYPELMDIHRQIQRVLGVSARREVFTRSVPAEAKPVVNPEVKPEAKVQSTPKEETPTPEKVSEKQQAKADLVDSIVAVDIDTATDTTSETTSKAKKK